MTDPLPTPPPPDVSFGVPARAAPAPKKGGAKTVILVLAAAFAFVLLVTAGLGGLIYFAATREGSTAAVKPTDREYVVTFEDLARHTVGLEKVESAEKLTRDDFLGSHELAYEYEPKDAGLYLTSSLTVDTSASSARDTYNGMALGMKVMFAAQGENIVLEDRDDLLKWGDASRAVLMKNEGKPVGNVFLARKGNRVFFFTLAGVYFEDPEAFAELLKPKLEKMAKYQP